MVLSLLATAVNAVVAVVLLRTGRKYQSIVLEADGRHLMTDVWASTAVVAGLGLVALTDVTRLDAIIALAVAGYILWTAVGLLWRSAQGLLDRALPEDELAALRAAVEANLGPGAAYHAVRTRRAGAVRFVEFHLLVPGTTTKAALPGAEVTIHIEPIEERASWEDSALLPLEQAERAKTS